jgi:regulator of replication initiation timing
MDNRRLREQLEEAMQEIQALRDENLHLKNQIKDNPNIKLKPSAR